MPGPDLHVYGAGLKDCSIKLADASTFDVEAIIEVTGAPKQDAVDVRGDDTLKTTFVFAQTEELTLKANAISFDVLQAITGDNYSSSATGSEIPLGTDSEQSPPFVEVTALIRAKRKDGTSTTVKKVWHKVQFYSTNVSSSDGKEMNLELSGRAFKTATDITGAALASSRITTVKEATNF